jgi:polysaccharide export outer membrane protein
LAWINRIPILPIVLLALLWLPVARATPVGDQPYVVGANDRFDVFVWQHDDLSLSLEVAADGSIRYPLIGRIQVVGMTPEMLAETIAEGLRTYIVDPQVTVIPRSFDKAAVAVIGQVKSGGLVEFREGARLSDYLAAAGGPTTEAKLSAVTVTRTVDGDPINYEIDLERVLTSGDPAVDFVLAEGDVVFVPKAFTLIDTRTLVLTGTGVLGLLSIVLRAF